MYAGEVLKRINGLTNDRLTYFVRAGYVRPKRIKRKNYKVAETHFAPNSIRSNIPLNELVRLLK